jgi:hypothetical protein
MVQSSNLDIDLPQGYVWYETMIVLRPDLTEEERCAQPTLVFPEERCFLSHDKQLRHLSSCQDANTRCHALAMCCRDVELAKFEAFLKKENAQEISALVRGNQHLAYPIKGCAPLYST